jgi:hypothetical protein
MRGDRIQENLDMTVGGSKLGIFTGRSRKALKTAEVGMQVVASIG